MHLSDIAVSLDQNFFTFCKFSDSYKAKGCLYLFSTSSVDFTKVLLLGFLANSA
jgi:hypothetical protein